MDQSSEISAFVAKKTAQARERLEYLRTQLRAESISWEEVHELQTLADYIDPGDVELLEAAGVPEFPERGTLYKTTVTIWTEYPTDSVGLEDLARQADSGDAYCSNQVCVKVEPDDAAMDADDGPNLEFFGMV